MNENNVLLDNKELHLSLENILTIHDILDYHFISNLPLKLLQIIRDCEQICSYKKACQESCVNKVEQLIFFRAEKL